MNYTTNYHLPQWVEEDRIMMGDFNEAMAGIDGGIAAAKTAADTAKTTADAAQATADAAYSPNNMPYAIGTYIGNNSTKTIELGFRPRFLIISGDEGSTSMVGHYQEYGEHVGFMSTDFIYDTVTLTDTGFKVVSNSSSYPRLNEHKTYIYIAFQ